MKSLGNIGEQLAGIPLLADDIIEFHAARLILLIYICGKKNKVEGLTKLAKLDFFIRYPQFFNIAVKELEINVKSDLDLVESSMVRHHYGPWDKRYYQILAYLEAKELLDVYKSGPKTYEFTLSKKGVEAAGKLLDDESFSELKIHMDLVSKAFSNKKGSYLKNMIYKVFADQVAAKELGEKI